MSRVILCLSLALILGLSALIQPAEAQITTFGASAIAINCPTLPGPGESPFDDPDHPCEKAVGITITVTNSETGEVYGSCETIDAGPEYDHGTCTVIAETEVPLTIREDPSTLPAGYSPVDNPTTITLPEGGPPPSAYFINVLQTQTEPPSVQPGDPYDLPIQVTNCTVVPAEPSAVPVEGCESAPGISFTVADANTGEAYGSCESAPLEDYDFAQCTVEVPVGSTVVVTEDTSTVPAGYAPRENPVTREILEAAIQAGEGAYAPFQNLLQTAPPAGAEPTPPPSDSGAPPTTQLPNTGAGPGASRSSHATAQDGTVDLVVNKINCPDLPGPDEFPFDNWVHECEPGPGIRFIVVEEGVEIGSCVTEVSTAPEPQALAYCTVPVNYGTTVVVTEDVSTVPEGYIAVDPPVVAVDVPAGPGGDQPLARFINVQQPPIGGEPAPQLPSTGTGPFGLKDLVSLFR